MYLALRLIKRRNDMDDPYASLFENITELTPLSPDQEDLVREAFRVKAFAKKEYLLSAGEVSNYMRFVADGCVRVYAVEDDREIITQFGIRGWWINDLYSYLTQSPSTQYIQAVQDTTVLLLHRDRLEELYETVPPIERFFRIKFQNAYTALQERHLQNISLSALERYEQFRKQYRDIEQRVPQYMVASYLGITKEFLSALRKKVH